MISIFGDSLAGCLVCGFLFGLGVVFCCLVACLVCFPHERDLLFLPNCVRIVCNLERPSELSWRARHGRKKKAVSILNMLDFFAHWGSDTFYDGFSLRAEVSHSIVCTFSVSVAGG